MSGTAVTTPTITVAFAKGAMPWLMRREKFGGPRRYAYCPRCGTQLELERVGDVGEATCGRCEAAVCVTEET